MVYAESVVIFLRLKELRSSRRLFQRDVAEAIGCTQAIYSRYESETREPTIATLVALADFYDVSLDYLVGRSDDPRRH